MRKKRNKNSSAFLFVPLILFCLIKPDLAAFQVGEEFQVNSRSNGHQEYPEVAMDGKGNFVITWASRDPDIAKSQVYARRFKPSGIPQSKDFRVNSYSQGPQVFPKVAINNTGKFIIVWEGGKAKGPNMGVSAQMFSPKGKRDGKELEVAYRLAELKWNPVIAMDKQGNFCIAWEDWALWANDWDVMAQRLDSEGRVIGPNFTVNTTKKDHQQASAIAMADNGSFVVTWYHWNGKNDIYARRFDNKGMPLGKEFRVNKSIKGTQSFPVIAMDKKGNFVIAWQGPGEDDTSGYVYARRFSRTGKALGAEFPVGARAEGSWGVDIDMNKKGAFVITWVSKLEGTGSDVLEDLKYEIYAQRFNKKGKPQGPPFLVNANTFGDQSEPAVAMDKKGNFVITWNSTNLDGSDTEIFARLFKN